MTGKFKDIRTVGVDNYLLLENLPATILIMPGAKITTKDKTSPSGSFTMSQLRNQFQNRMIEVHLLPMKDRIELMTTNLVILTGNDPDEATMKGVLKHEIVRTDKDAAR